MVAAEILESCPSCGRVTPHREEGRFDRCAACYRFHRRPGATG